MKLSVVIITYNMGHLISTALESLRKQNFREFETIIVDNHSTDNTDEILNQFSDLNLKTVKIHNEGILSKSRNAGIKVATGEWIAFLDADDYWEPDKVSVLMDTVEGLSENTIAVTHKCFVQEIGSDSRSDFIKWKVPKGDYHRNLIIGRNPFALSGTTVRKDALVRYGGFSEKDSFKTVEDYELWIRLSAYGDFLYIDRALSTLVLHEGNYSKKTVLQMKALDTMKKHYIENDPTLSDSDRKKAYKTLYMDEMRRLQVAGFHDEAKRIYREAKERRAVSWKLMVINLLVILRKKAEEDVR